VLEEADDDEIRSLAEAIVRTQSDEIDQMNNRRPSLVRGRRVGRGRAGG
jgi:uncharacterized protein (DUF305 family)